MSEALSYFSRVESNYRSVNHAKGWRRFLNVLIWGFRVVSLVFCWTKSQTMKRSWPKSVDWTSFHRTSVVSQWQEREFTRLIWTFSRLVTTDTQNAVVKFL